MVASHFSAGVKAGTAVQGGVVQSCWEAPQACACPAQLNASELTRQVVRHVSENALQHKHRDGSWVGCLAVRNKKP